MIQLAGHIGAISKISDGKIKKKANDSEAMFYTDLVKNPLDNVINPFIPNFFGLEEQDNHSMIKNKEKTIKKFYL